MRRIKQKAFNQVIIKDQNDRYQLWEIISANFRRTSLAAEPQ